MKLTNNNIYQEIKELLYSAKNRVYQTINTTMTQTYFQIGKWIVEEEQGGEIRAEYGSALLKNLSSELIKEFGKGYSEQNLKNMRQFYLIYQKRQTVSSEFKLSWSHYIFLTRIENINERNFYEIESIENSWSLRELKRQFDSGLFERLKLSSDKQKLKELSLINSFNLYIFLPPCLFFGWGITFNQRQWRAQFMANCWDKASFHLFGFTIAGDVADGGDHIQQLPSPGEEGGVGDSNGNWFQPALSD